MKKILQLALIAALPICANAQTFSEEHFNTGNSLNLSGDNVKPYVNITETSCGEAKIVDNNIGDDLPAAFKPLVFSPRTECGSLVDPIDMTSNPKVSIRIRGAKGLELRVRLVSEKPVGVTSSPKIGNERKTLATDYEFEDLVWDFSGDIAGAEANFDITKITNVFIEFDPSSAEFTGDSLYLDYIILGDAPTNVTVASCKSDVDQFGDGTSSFFIEDFLGDVAGLAGEGADLVTLTQANSILTVEEKDGSTLGEFKPLLLTLPETKDITGNQKVVIVAEPKGGDLEMRIDLRATFGPGETNSTNGCSGRITRTFPADVVTTMEFEFSDIAFKDINEDIVDKMSIEGLAIFFTGQDGLGVDAVDFHLISLGEMEEPNGLFDLNAKEKLSVHPNPASDFINVNSVEKGSLRIVNQMGQVVESFELTTGVQKISISDLDQGVYIVSQILESGSVISTSLVKQ